MRRLSFTTTNLFDWCLKFFILLTPIIWLEGIAQRPLQLLCFHYGAIILFGIAIVLPSKRRFSNYNIPLLLLFSIIITLVRSPLGFSIVFLNILLGSLLYYAIVRGVNDIKSVSRWFIYLLLINLAVMLLQAVGLDLVYAPHVKEVKLFGLMGSSNQLAMFAAIVTPIISMTYFNLIWVVYGLLFALKSHTAYFGYFVGLIVLIWFLNRHKYSKVFSMGLVLFVVASCVYLSPHLASSFGSRFPAWGYMLKESFINPFLGNGLGVFAIDRNMNLSQLMIGDSYNDYFRLLYEFGSAMTIILFMSIFIYYKRLFLKARKYFTPKVLLASVCAGLACMITRDVLTTVRLAIPFLIILALFEASCLDSITKEACNGVSEI